jgi:hypothetical protein
VQWNDATLPPASSLGVKEIVVAWEDASSSALLATARKQGYRVYVKTPLKQATSAAKGCAEKRCAGIILKVPESENAEAEKSVASLRSAAQDEGQPDHQARLRARSLKPDRATMD